MWEEKLPMYKANFSSVTTENTTEQLKKRSKTKNIVKRIIYWVGVWNYCKKRKDIQSTFRNSSLPTFIFLVTHDNKNFNKHQDFEIDKDVCDYVYDKINNRNMLKLFFTCIWTQKGSYIINWLGLFSCFSSVVVGDNNFYDNASYLYLIFLTGLYEFCFICIWLCILLENVP